MPCQNRTSCSRCPYMVKSTNIVADCTYMSIVVPKMVLHQGQPLCIVLAQNIPASVNANTKVLIRNDEFNVALLTNTHNFVYADQLCSRRVLRTRIATDTGFAYLLNSNGIKRTNHVFPTIPETVPYQPPQKKPNEDEEEGES